MAEDKQVKKDAPTSLRMYEDDKEKLQKFIEEEGKSQKDFMASLMGLYELNKSKAKNINLVGDIEQLEQLTAKVNNVFINVIEKLEGQKDVIASEKDKELSVYKDRIESLSKANADITSNYEMLQEVYNNISKEYEMMKEQVTQLNNTIKDKASLVEEYKGKNDYLLGEVAEHKQVKESLEAYKGLLADAGAKELTLTNNLNGSERQNEELKKELEKIKAEYEEKLKRDKADHQKEITEIKKSLELEKKLAIAEVKEQLTNKHNAEYEKHLQKIETLMNEKKELSDKLLNQQKQQPKPKPQGKTIENKK